MRNLFKFPFGCQKHSAGVRAVHDSDFSNGLFGQSAFAEVFSLTVSHDER